MVNARHHAPHVTVSTLDLDSIYDKLAYLVISHCERLIVLRSTLQIPSI
jgi:hypothetical protein